MSEFGAELTQLISSLAGSGNVDRWPELEELGLVGIGTAERAGGSGGSLGDLLVAIRELARSGIPSPIVEASTALYAVGPSDAFVTVAVTDADLRSSTVTSDLGPVPYAGTADRIVLVGIRDIAFVTAGPGLTVELNPDISGAPAAEVRLSDVTVQRHDDGPGADAVAARLALSRAAALLGSATAAYDLTRGYVAERQQFGAPLIAIPAVSAELAQMAVRIHTTQSANDRAVAILDDDASTVQRRLAAAASARIIAADMATQVARSAHKLHGAVGITNEYGLHSHTRRLWAWRDADIAERVWRERLGRVARSGDEAVLWGELTA